MTTATPWANMSQFTVNTLARLAQDDRTARYSCNSCKTVFETTVGIVQDCGGEIIGGTFAPPECPACGSRYMAWLNKEEFVG